MPESVYESQVASLEGVKAVITDLFQMGKYEDIPRAIGLYSVTADPQHTISAEAQLERFVLDLIKNRIRKGREKSYGLWLESFPKLLAKVVSKKQLSDAQSLEVIASYEAGRGFRSLDEFFFWAMDDRLLPLGQIVECIERTAKK